MMANQRSTLANKWFRDKHHKLTLMQIPNVPIIIWFAVTVLSHLLMSGAWQTAANLIASGALFVWALLEIFWGINYFRRSLGLIILVALLMHMAAD